MRHFAPALALAIASALPLALAPALAPDPRMQIRFKRAGAAGMISEDSPQSVLISRGVLNKLGEG